MSIAKCLVVPSVVLWLAAATAAQEVPPLVSVVPVPGGPAQVLLTRVDAASGTASSLLVAPGGATAAATGHAAAGSDVSLSPVLAQRFRTHYTDVLGWQHQLETSELTGESPDQHAARHAAALAQLVAQFPPAAGGAGASATKIEPGEQILKSAWLGVDGLDHEVLTARKPNENMEKWAERHADGVAAMLKVFPPKPTFALAARSGARVV